MRRTHIEKDLQQVLENGHNVWAIGDVHGFSLTLERLLDECDLSLDDRVVLLGDLIDRGPDSYDVVRIARSDPRIYCVKGNHEDMMVNSFHLERLDEPNSDIRQWLYNGGLATVASYIRDYTDEFGQEDSEQLRLQIIDDKEWMEGLPAHIVLDKWRLVHAGYDPRIELDNQEEDTLLWIRRPFYGAEKPIDEKRAVVFGHTPTMNLNTTPDTEKWGRPWFSQVELDDGRSASIGLDTCLFHEEQQPAMLTAYNLQTLQILRIPRVERWDEAIREQVKKV